MPVQLPGRYQTPQMDWQGAMSRIGQSAGNVAKGFIMAPQMNMEYEKLKKKTEDLKELKEELKQGVLTTMNPDLYTEQQRKQARIAIDNADSVDELIQKGAKFKEAIDFYSEYGPQELPMWGMKDYVTRLKPKMDAEKAKERSALQQEGMQGQKTKAGRIEAGLAATGGEVPLEKGASQYASAGEVPMTEYQRGSLDLAKEKLDIDKEKIEKKLMTVGKNEAFKKFTTLNTQANTSKNPSTSILLQARAEAWRSVSESNVKSPEEAESAYKEIVKSPEFKEKLMNMVKDKIVAGQDDVSRKIKRVISKPLVSRDEFKAIYSQYSTIFPSMEEMAVELDVKLEPEKPKENKGDDGSKEAKENFISKAFDFGKGLISGSTPNRYQDMYNKPPGATTQATAAPVMGSRGGARMQAQPTPVRINSKEERDRLAPGTPYIGPDGVERRKT